MSLHADRRPLRRSLRAMLVLLVATVLLMGGRATFAFFTDSATITSNGITAGSVAKPAISSVETSGNGIKISWGATSVGGTVATGYQVKRYQNAGGTGEATTVCTGRALTCTDSPGPAGTVSYKLVATIGDNWSNTSSPVDYTPSVGVPVNVRCVSDGNDSYVGWSAPSGLAPTGYRISYSVGGRTGSTEVGPSVIQYQPPRQTLFSTQTATVTVTSLYNNVTSAQSGSAKIVVYSGLFVTNYTC